MSLWNGSPERSPSRAQQALGGGLRSRCTPPEEGCFDRLPRHRLPPRIQPVDPKKTPSNREYQLLAVLLRNEWTAGKGAELNGRQMARAYEVEADETIPYGTVYTLLGAMEESGWVRSREDLHEGRRTRWYRINRKGLDAVERWRKRSSTLLDLTTPPPSRSSAPKSPKPKGSQGSSSSEQAQRAST